MKGGHTRWIRWLSARGVPPGHIARVLAVDVGDVAEGLRDRHRQIRYDIDADTGARIRELRAAGLIWRAIGAALGIPWYAAHDWHELGRMWRPSVPTRPPRSGGLRGRVGGWVRRLAELGYEAGQVAELLALDADQVAAFVAGRPRPKDPPRWPDWHASNGPDYRPDDSPLPGLPDLASDVIEPEISATAGIESNAPVASEWGPWMAPRPGALDADQLVRLRYWRHRGIELDELARWFECSVATVKRALAAGYRPAPSPATAARLPPAIAAAELASAVRWDPADDD